MRLIDRRQFVGQGAAAVAMLGVAGTELAAVAGETMVETAIPPVHYFPIF